MSLRSALAARSGLAALANRSARRQVERGDPFKRRGRIGVLTDAIEYRQTVSFWYSNEDSPRTGRRIGNPHGIVQRGRRRYLVMWTLPGSASASRRLPGWRTFILERIRSPKIQVNRVRIGGRLQRFTVAPGFSRFREGRYLARI